jgi:hypothetical protein
MTSRIIDDFKAEIPAHRAFGYLRRRRIVRGQFSRRYRLDLR